MLMVYKYPISRAGRFRLVIPGFQGVALVGMQEGLPHFWAFADPEEEDEEHWFILVGTGQPVHEGVVWQGSFLAPPFVWHLFEEVYQVDRVDVVEDVV